MNYILPEEYIELDYIESTGTQYINFGRKSTSKTKFEFEYKSNKLAGEVFQNIFGSQNGTTDARIYIQLEADNDIALQFPHYGSHVLYCITSGSKKGTLNQTTSESHLKINEDEKVNIIYDLVNQKVIVNNETFTLLTPYSLKPSINNILFFNRNSTTTPDTNLCVGKLYYFKWYENDQLIMDLVPCLRKTDNEIGLFDKINKNFITNSGTGTFGSGNPKINKLLENINEFLRVNL